MFSSNMCKTDVYLWPFWHVRTCMNMLKRCLPTEGRDGGRKGGREVMREGGRENNVYELSNKYHRL